VKVYLIMHGVVNHVRLELYITRYLPTIGPNAETTYQVVYNVTPLCVSSLICVASCSAWQFQRQFANYAISNAPIPSSFISVTQDVSLLDVFARAWYSQLCGFTLSSSVRQSKVAVHPRSCVGPCHTRERLRPDRLPCAVHSAGSLGRLHTS
jgi:hypothetical protein